jgi:hypothetical protein
MLPFRMQRGSDATLRRRIGLPLFSRRPDLAVIRLVAGAAHAGHFSTMRRRLSIAAKTRCFESPVNDPFRPRISVIWSDNRPMIRNASVNGVAGVSVAANSSGNAEILYRTLGSRSKKNRNVAVFFG